jgi:hypothetical protein
MNKKRYWLVGLSLFLTLLALALAIYLIYYSSQVNWFLAVIVAFICIVLIACLAWYCFKAFFSIKQIRDREDRIEAVVKKTDVSSPFNEAVLDKVFTKDKYKKIVSHKDTYRFAMYLKLNEASPLYNYIFAWGEDISDVIFFSNIVNQEMLIHDVPEGTFNTVICFVCPKPSEETKKLTLLNNPYNVLRKKIFFLYAEKSQNLFGGIDKELISSEFVQSAYMQMDALFHTRQGL